MIIIRKISNQPHSGMRCMHAHTHTHAQTHANTYAHTLSHMRARTDTHTHTHTHMHTHTHTCTHHGILLRPSPHNGIIAARQQKSYCHHWCVCACVCVCVCSSVCMRVRAYACMCTPRDTRVCVCARTQTHTHAHRARTHTCAIHTCTHVSPTDTFSGPILGCIHTRGPHSGTHLHTYVSVKTPPTHTL